MAEIRPRWYPVRKVVGNVWQWAFGIPPKQVKKPKPAVIVEYRRRTWQP